MTTTFKRLAKKLNLITPEVRERELFDEWMKNKVKSIYYSDNEKMLNAYNKIN